MHHRARRQHVQVHKIAGVGVAEIRIAQVAPTRDTHGIVGNEELVVHALLQALEVAQHAEHAAQV